MRARAALPELGSQGYLLALWSGLRLLGLRLLVNTVKALGVSEDWDSFGFCVVL